METKVRDLAAQALEKRRAKEVAGIEQCVTYNTAYALQRVKELLGVTGEIAYIPRIRTYTVDDIVVNLDDDIYVKIKQTLTSSGTHFFYLVLVIPLENGGFSEAGESTPIKIESLADLGEALESYQAMR